MMKQRISRKRCVAYVACVALGAAGYLVSTRLFLTVAVALAVAVLCVVNEALLRAAWPNRSGREPRWESPRGYLAGALISLALAIAAYAGQPEISNAAVLGGLSIYCLRCYINTGGGTSTSGE